MTNFRSNFFILICLSFVGCAHSVHQVHVADHSPYRSQSKGKLVKAQSEQFVILNFASETRYVDDAYRKLQKRCPRGTIRGITTEYMTNLGFFSWTNRIIMQGWCYS